MKHKRLVAGILGLVGMVVGLSACDGTLLQNPNQLPDIQKVEQAVVQTLTALAVETTMQESLVNAISGTLTAVAQENPPTEAPILTGETSTLAPADALSEQPSETPSPSAEQNEPSPTAPLIAPVNPESPADVYELKSEDVFGNAIFRFWRTTGADPLLSGGIMTIDAPGQAPRQINNATGFGAMTGQDLNLDGSLEVVVEGFTGGAHCCFTTNVYSTIPGNLREILALGPSQCGAGVFEDINYDGVMEFVTCEDAFDYMFCAHAASPFPVVVYQFDQLGEYLPASANFSERVLVNEARDIKLAEQTVAGEMGESDGTNKCAVLPIVLDYLYAGRTELAWSMLDQYYVGADRADFQTKIAEIVFNSPRYQAPD